jgi:hypothetical protein
VNGAASQLAAVKPRCRLCTCLLNTESPADDFIGKLCTDCRKRPEAAKPTTARRGFTVADKALIGKVHGYMPAQQLLDVLNQRLVADLGEGAEQHTLEQLHEEIREIAPAATGGDWAGLRQLIAQARRDGVLDQVSAQTIDDFAIVFSLTPAQVLRVKDVILSARSTS